MDALVTHNTAILGILGIGKSRLAFELIKKIVETGVKVQPHCNRPLCLRHNGPTCRLGEVPETFPFGV